MKTFVIFMLMLGSFSIGCSRGEIFVPELATARDQFALAQQKEKDLVLADKKSERYALQIQEVTVAYEKVVERFADDLEFTPWAKVRLSQMYKDQGAKRKALRMIDSVLNDYGDQELVDAKARFMKGRILEDMGRKLEAQQTYRDCKERYKNSENTEVKRIAADCDRLYSRILTLD